MSRTYGVTHRHQSIALHLWKKTMLVGLSRYPRVDEQYVFHDTLKLPNLPESTNWSSLVKPSSSEARVVLCLLHPGVSSSILPSQTLRTSTKYTGNDPTDVRQTAAATRTVGPAKASSVRATQSALREPPCTTHKAATTTRLGRTAELATRAWPLLKKPNPPATRPSCVTR